MAIIQISKIQVRSGNLVDLPQLDDAEFGWASDAKKLYIGKTTPNENIEVLTSYSNIYFSQLNGSYGNLNITTPVTGQTISYDRASNTWVNSGGNALDPGNSSYYSNTPVHLGNVSNVYIGGGAIGYVLETDGTGNLSWTPKGTISANISGATITTVGAQPNGVVITTSSNNFFTDGARVTITNVGGMTQLNGNSYYADVLTANTFSLYSDSGLTTPVDGTGYTTYTSGGRAIASIGGGAGTGAAGGTTYTVQYNNGGLSTGDANFQWNFTTQLLSVTGTANISQNVNVTSNISAGNVSATGNANVGNLNATGLVSASQVSANSNGLGINFKVGDDAYIGDINVTNTMVVKGQQDGANGYIIFGNGDTTSTLGRAGTGPLTYNGAFSVVGNANIGNIGTAGVVTATGNITGGNLVTGGAISATGNLNAGNIITGGIVSATGNGTFGNVTATLHVGNLSGTGNSNVGNLGATGIFATTLSASGNANVGNLNTTVISAGANTTLGTITGNWTLTAGSRLQSTYADLAEYYEADDHYAPGTVLAFGGEKEVTIAEDGTTRVAGVVSTDPAYAMNAKCPGIAVAIALQGRVPVKVRGKVRKGDLMVSAGNGFARPWNNAQPGMIIGKSIENFDGVEGIIEIAVGRL